MLVFNNAPFFCFARYGQLQRVCSAHLNSFVSFFGAVRVMPALVFSMDTLTQCYSPAKLPMLLVRRWALELRDLASAFPVYGVSCL
jgi:hypothetical protein